MAPVSLRLLLAPVGRTMTTAPAEDPMYPRSRSVFGLGLHPLLFYGSVFGKSKHIEFSLPDDFF